MSAIHAFRNGPVGSDAPADGRPCPTLIGTHCNHIVMHDYAPGQPAYALPGNLVGRQDKNGPNGLGVAEGTCPTLTVVDRHCVARGAVVRRLTPLECERLQGFPDGWTALGAGGEALSDAARYRMLGNSVAVPCVSYVLGGIARVMRGAGG